MPTVSRRILMMLLFMFALLAVPPLSLIALSISMNAWRTTMLPRVRAWWRTARKKPFGRWLRKSRLFPRRRVRPGIDALNVHIARHFRQPGTRLWTVIWAFVVLATLTTLVIHVRTKTIDDYVTFGWQQGALTFALGVSSLGLSWVSSPVRLVVKGLFVTVVGSLVISATLLFARGMAIDFFSTYFPFSLTYLPMSFGVGVVLLAFAWTSLLFVVFALILELGMFGLVMIANVRKYGWATGFVALAWCISFLGAYVTALAIEQTVTVRGQLFMIALAAQYDFTSSHMCNASASEKVLFIDSAPDRAYAATFPSMRGIVLGALSADTMARYLPVEFHTVGCNPLDDTNAHRRWCKGKEGFVACPSAR
jgi:hypothetical protein